MRGLRSTKGPGRYVGSGSGETLPILPFSSKAGAASAGSQETKALCGGVSLCTGQLVGASAPPKSKRVSVVPGKRGSVMPGGGSERNVVGGRGGLRAAASRRSVMPGASGHHSAGPPQDTVTPESEGIKSVRM